MNPTLSAQRTNMHPVFIMREPGVTDQQMVPVLDGINEVLSIAQVSREIEVIDFGVWRSSEYDQGGTLKAWHSVDWYLAYAQLDNSRPGQINADNLIRLFYSEPWQEQKRHYDVLVLNSDIYAPGTNYVIGLALPGSSTVISTHRFAGLGAHNQMECIKTETMHEVGHVFGLVPDERTENVEESLGKHCTNRCTMRQGLRVPHDWVNITRDRLAYGAFCPECVRDLRQFWRR